MKKLVIWLLAAAMLLCLAACGAGEPAEGAQPSAPGNTQSPPSPPAKSVETDLADMTWDEVLAEARGQRVTLNVYNADTQVAKFWDQLVGLAGEYGIEVTIVSETADTDARMIADYASGDPATYDMTWGYYGYTFKAYHDAGCLWGDQQEQWVKYLPNAQYIDWESSSYQYDCGLPTNYMESPLMGLTPMLVYLSTEYDASLAWDASRPGEDGAAVYGLFHDLTELSQWVRLHPGRFTYLDLTGSGAFHGKCFLMSILYELTGDGDGGWKAVYDEADDQRTRYDKIEANAQAWYAWMAAPEANAETFAERAAYVWAYLNDLEPYLLQGDQGPLYGSDAYMMADYVNSKALATSFTTSFSISPKLDNDPSYLSGAGQAYMMQTSVFAADYLVITKNSASKAACMVLANLLLDPTVQADCFAMTGNTYNVDISRLSAEDATYFDTVFSALRPGTTPTAADLASSSHVNIGGNITAWLTDCWLRYVVNS